MYDNLKRDFSWADRVNYSSCNGAWLLEATLDKLNQKYKVGNFFAVEGVRKWSDLTYRDNAPIEWSAMFIAQIVEYSPIQGTMNIFTGKKRITKLPRLIVKAPDGTEFEPLVFSDSGKDIEASAADLTVKYLLENACIEEIATEDFSMYSRRIWMSAMDRDEALRRFTAYNIKKEETAERLESEYAAHKRRLAEQEKIRKQKAEELRKREAKDAESREMFNNFFG